MEGRANQVQVQARPSHRDLPVADSQCLDGNGDGMAVDSDVEEDSDTSDTACASKCPALRKLMRSSLKRRQVDYVEKGSTEFKGKANQYRDGECSLSRDDRRCLDFGSSNGAQRHKPVKEYHTVKLVER
jgi:hypothetical protein